MKEIIVLPKASGTEWYFHPYDEEELRDVVGDNVEHHISAIEDGFMLICRKYAENERE